MIPKPFLAYNQEPMSYGAASILQPLEALAPDALTRFAWRVLVADRVNLGLPDLTVVDLQDFLKAAEDPTQNPNIMGHDDRILVLEKTEALIGNLYPHLPFKLQDFPDADPPVDPIGRIKALRARVDAQDSTLGELSFQIEMLKIFASVRDPHTSYTLPTFFRGVLAFLPFRIGAYVDAGRNRFIITSVMDGFAHLDFKPGAELISPEPGFPDFTPIVNKAAMLTPGATPDSQMQRGLLRLTLMPLSTSATSRWSPPYENLCGDFTYLPEGSSAAKSISLPWGVARATGLGKSVPGQAFSVSQDLCALRDAVNVLWNRGQCYDTVRAMLANRMATGKPPQQPAYAVPSPPPPAAPAPQPDSIFPDVFEFQTTSGISTQSKIVAATLTSSSHPDKQFGYIAIKAFDTPLASELSLDLPNEFARILTLLQPHAPDGLILDIRSNPGGGIVAAESMLHMLTPAPITPANFHLANTDAIAKILASVAAAPLGSPLAPWVSGQQAPPLPPDGPYLTVGMPLTTSPNSLGQVYQGPVVLLVDAMTYSAADIFAGGFSDNGVGKIIGPDRSTGGGGASLWSYAQLMSDLPSTDLNLLELPHGTDMSLAFMRSTRVGPSLEIPIEDKGVTPDLVFHRTLNDLLTQGAGSHSDLFTFACDTLSDMPVHRIEVTALPGNTQINVTATNLDQIDFQLDQDSTPVQPTLVANIVQPMNIPLRSDGSQPGQITVRGWAGGRLVATRQLVFDERALNMALDRRLRD